MGFTTGLSARLGTCLAVCAFLGTFLAPSSAAFPSSGKWQGFWSDYPADQTRSVPVTLTLSSTDPIKGTIVVPSMGCTSSWTETNRTSDTLRTVAANNIGGPCRDNVWNVTLEADGRISGTDSVDSGVIVNLTPSR